MVIDKKMFSAKEMNRKSDGSNDIFCSMFVRLKHSIQNVFILCGNLKTKNYEYQKLTQS